MSFLLGGGNVTIEDLIPNAKFRNPYGALVHDGSEFKQGLIDSLAYQDTTIWTEAPGDGTISYPGDCLHMEMPASGSTYPQVYATVACPPGFGLVVQGHVTLVSTGDGQAVHIFVGQDYLDASHRASIAMARNPSGNQELWGRGNGGTYVAKTLSGWHCWLRLAIVPGRAVWSYVDAAASSVPGEADWKEIVSKGLTSGSTHMITRVGMAAENFGGSADMTAEWRSLSLWYI